MKCTYSNPPTAMNGLVPPLLADATSASVLAPWYSASSVPASGFGLVESQVSAAVLQHLDSISRKSWPIDIFISAYFSTFHRSFPILNEKIFRSQLQEESLSAGFSTLLLAMVLISNLSSKIAFRSVDASKDGGKTKEELYSTLKNIYSSLLSTGNVTTEIVQAGIIIAAYEYCQAMHQDAWLSIGTCARLGQVLGLHLFIRKPMPPEPENRAEFEMRRCTWWGVVVLERIINTSSSSQNLPFASQAPCLDDLLPLVPNENGESYPVSTDLVTPNLTDGQIELFNREFTRLGNFGSTIQACYLSTLVTAHITNTCTIPEDKQEEARKLDTALQSFGCVLIPPPGMAVGSYCGAYGLRTLEAFTLHSHSLTTATRAGDKDGIARATIALQSLARTTIHMTKASSVGRPLDFDGMAFWANAIVAKAAMVHIRLGDRDKDWKGDLEVLKDLLGWLAPRFRLYGMCFHFDLPGLGRRE